MKTAGQVDAGRESAVEGAVININLGERKIQLRDEIALEVCLETLYYRQDWFRSLWEIMGSAILPKIEIQLDGNDILVVFFEKGKLLGLINRVKFFSRVIIIMPGGEISKTDVSEIESLRSFSLHLGIVNHSELPGKRAYYATDLRAVIFEGFFQTLEESINDYTHVSRSQMHWVVL